MEMEKSTRRVDELGRIVLSLEIRRAMDLTEKSELEMWVEPEKNQIIIHKGKPTCMCCGAEEDLKKYRSKWICSTCQSEITEL